MARPKCARLVDDLPGTTYFKPRGIPLVELEEITLAVDEFEALRLADLDSLYQEEAAGRMHVSRATFGRILESAHAKVAEALIRGKAIRIEGGIVTMAAKRMFQCSDCEHTWEVPFGTRRPTACPQCGGHHLHRSDANCGRGGGRGKGRCRRSARTTVSAKEST